MSAPLMDVAPDYVRDYSWRLLPLVPKSKKPLIKNWTEAATDDLAQLRAWATEWPSAGLGVLLGQATGTVVIDVDGSEGAALVEKMNLPETLTATTGKGKHYFFRSPAFPVKKKIRIFPEVDLLGDGCFVIVEPSIHPGGTQYHFDNYGHSLAPLPQVILDRLGQDDPPALTKEKSNVPGEAIQNGQRNATLTTWAGKMRRIGLAPGEILAALSERNRFCDPPLSPAEVEGIARSVCRYEPSEPGDSGPLSVNLSEIEPRAVEWLWPNYIPIGGGTLISGDPGSGKTWLVMDSTARLSRGTKWIDGIKIEAPANTLYLSVEDDAANTIRPRIDSLGGDPARVFVYNTAQPLHLDLSGAPGIDRLEDEIQRIGNIRLVVVDPIADFSGDTNPNAGEEVRALLTPLLQMAAKYQFALVLVGHLNKAQSMGAIYRAGGSTSGWLGKCRAAFMVFRDMDDKKLRHVVALKANLATDDPPQLEFTISEGQVMAHVSSEQVDVDEHLNPKHGPRPREKEAATEWLGELFNDRESIPSTEIEAAAEVHGISLATLKRAKREGHYGSKKMAGEWQWTKPLSF